MAFKMPRVDERVLILGSTGSGKTTMGAWLLSQAPFNKIPYVIIDYKRDALLAGIDRSEEIGFNEIPKQPGVYHIKPNPVVDDDAIEDWLLKVWGRRNIGLYIDEALRIPTSRKGAFEAILTQGRSLHIPVISLSQRPVDLTRYAFSEANHVAAFRLTDIRDRKSVSEYVPIPKEYGDSLPEFHSIWYNVGQNRKYTIKPVPEGEEILDTFWERLKPKRCTL